MQNTVSARFQRRRAEFKLWMFLPSSKTFSRSAQKRQWTKFLIGIWNSIGTFVTNSRNSWCEKFMFLYFVFPLFYCSESQIFQTIHQLSLSCRPQQSRSIVHLETFDRWWIFPSWYDENFGRKWNGNCSSGCYTTSSCTSACLYFPFLLLNVPNKMCKLDGWGVRIRAAWNWRWLLHSLCASLLQRWSYSHVDNSAKPIFLAGCILSIGSF